METSFTVTTQHFSGPLDLLLDLIEKRKLHISDVSLAEVSESFLQYLKEVEELPKDEAAEFLVTASTLMLIKSVSLLPGLQLTEEETESMESLERRLQILARVREGALILEKCFGINPIYLPVTAPPRTPIFFLPHDATLPQLIEAMKALLASFPKHEQLNKVVIKKIISMEEVIGSLLQRVKHALSLSFNDFVGDKKEKMDVIVSFLGMLELIKQGTIAVRQEGHFSDIHMESQDLDTPRYS